MDKCRAAFGGNFVIIDHISIILIFSGLVFFCAEGLKVNKLNVFDNRLYTFP